MNLHSYPELMTVDEMAEYLRTSSRTILNWIAKGEVPAAKIGSEWRFRRDDIQRWVDNQFSPSPVASGPLRLDELVPKENVLVVKETKKGNVLNCLLDHLLQSPNVTCRKTVTDAIFAREELMSTGIGLQIGVPHVRIPEVKQMTVGVALTEKPIDDYESIDSEPVRLIVMILARDDQHQDHLRLMAELSDRLKSDSKRKNILTSTTSTQLYHRLIAS